jgi:hypothetical protein
VYNITGGRDLTLMEVNRVSEVVTSLADPACNIIFGAVVDDMYEGEIHVTIIATGVQPWLCCSAGCSAVQHMHRPDGMLDMLRLVSEHSRLGLLPASCNCVGYLGRLLVSVGSSATSCATSQLCCTAHAAVPLPPSPPPAGFSQTFEDQLLNKKPAKGEVVGGKPVAGPKTADAGAAGQGQPAPQGWARPGRAAGSFLGRNIF